MLCMFVSWAGYWIGVAAEKKQVSSADGILFWARSGCEVVWLVTVRVDTVALVYKSEMTMEAY